MRSAIKIVVEKSSGIGARPRMREGQVEQGIFGSSIFLPKYSSYSPQIPIDVII
jgi:hypothetical protein